MNLTHSWRADDAQKIAEDLFQTANFVVACAADEPDQVFSWLAYEFQPRPTIFYVYTKQVYRKMGIAKQLLCHVFPESHTIQAAFIPPAQSHFADLIKGRKVINNSFYLAARILCVYKH